MSSLSAIILTHNESHNIEACINSCLFADEILVIDDNSTDNTVEIATATHQKVTVYLHKLNSDWAQQRNYAISRATGDFILFIDADERVSQPLQRSIEETIKKQNSKSSIFAFKRVNSFAAGQPRHGVFRPDWIIRLFPKGSGHYERPVHEKYISNLPVKNIKGELLHYTYKNWDAYWSKFNTYSKISADNYYKTGKKVCLPIDLVLRPLWAFFKIFILNLGFLDGYLGWIFSVNHFAYTLSKYSRLYSLIAHKGKL